MKQIIYFNDFESAFNNMNRENQFSNPGLQALFDYLEQYEEETGQEIELDVIALCCEYTEYKDLEELKESYDMIGNMEDLENYTTVIMIDEVSFIIQDF